MARRAEENTRGVQFVREHFSTTCNAAIGQNMEILKQVLVAFELGNHITHHLIRSAADGQAAGIPVVS
jgi:hypothetical protein